MKKILDLLFGAKAALFYIAAFAIAIASATFIENDYGTDSAQKVIYQAWWFELLLLAFSLSLIHNMIRFKLLRRKMSSVLLFHLAFIVIIIGAGITRFSGFEGMMHIRQGETSNTFVSSESYLKFDFQKSGQSFSTEEPVIWSSLGSSHFKKAYQIGDQLVEFKLKELVVNPAYELVERESGKPYLKLVFGASLGRQEYFLAYGEHQDIQGIHFNFSNSPEEGSFNIILENGRPMVLSDQPYHFMRMADRSVDSISSDSLAPMALRSLYNYAGRTFVFGEFRETAALQRFSEGLKLKNESTIGLELLVKVGEEQSTVYLEGAKGYLGRPQTLQFKDLKLELAYGAKLRTLPFQIKLHEFQMERYPGTNSPASYASEVQLIDPEQGLQSDYRIYMNHILTHRGYRFFQSSYDRDEKGTYLSVNHDFWGTWISYLGYFLLTLGMLWTLISKESRFSLLGQQIKRLRAKRAAVSVALLLCLPMAAQDQLEARLPVVQASHAEAFSEVLVQDIRGRMKPMHSLSREVMRKVYGSESYRGLNADQVLLSIWAENSVWYGEAILKMPFHPRFAELGYANKYHAYRDFFAEDGSYKLSSLVQEANNTIDKEKGTFEKAILKLDEKVNIINMMLSGYLLRIIPLEGDPNNTWVSDHSHGNASSVVAEKFFPTYRVALLKGFAKGDFSTADGIIQELKNYQDKQDPSLLPSPKQRSLEIVLNELNVFNRLAFVYLILGLGFLTSLFIQVFKPKLSMQLALRILGVLVALAFVFHTTGLGLRWYVSGRAPWSNGYESMIYIAWTATLAGLLFSRKSAGAMAATNVLSGVVLLIAYLSYLNPEITPLVPVLRSYWLTIHVSLEAGSYGFLMLGAIIGIINLLLMIFLSPDNKRELRATINEMTKISEMTLIGGLFMLSIGTYLGGVWANESWGRYWGWDAKETWALVSILVYAFILHMRFVPKLAGLFAFNFASLFGLASIIMTYYGVNYYLSGLHSYAAGDPVPVPSWVFYSVSSLVLISLLAFWRQKKMGLNKP